MRSMDNDREMDTVQALISALQEPDWEELSGDTPSVEEWSPVEDGLQVHNFLLAETFHLLGKVIGWNPNWSIELSKEHELGRELRDIHARRITDASVQEIEYIILENYKISDDNAECFGMEFILKVLDMILHEYKEQCKECGPLEKGVSKFKIWVLPDRLLKDTTLPLYELLELYKQLIYISGGDGVNDAGKMAIFINDKKMLAGHYHRSAGIVHGKDRYYGYCIGHFTRIKQLLRENNIHPTTINYDEDKKAFEFV